MALTGAGGIGGAVLQLGHLQLLGEDEELEVDKGCRGGGEVAVATAAAVAVAVAGAVAIVAVAAMVERQGSIVPL